MGCGYGIASEPLVVARDLRKFWLRRVRLVLYQRQGSPVVLQDAQGSQVLAEASLFAARYHCDAVSDDGARLSRVSKARLLQAQREDAGWLADMAAHLAREVQQARARAELLALRTVAEQLDAWLALHGELPARGRWLEVSQEIGATPEALYRELARRAGTGKPATTSAPASRRGRLSGPG